jgi:hypothetical protein
MGTKNGVNIIQRYHTKLHRHTCQPEIHFDEDKHTLGSFSSHVDQEIKLLAELQS